VLEKDGDVQADQKLSHQIAKLNVEMDLLF